MEAIQITISGHLILTRFPSVVLWDNGKYVKVFKGLLITSMDMEAIQIVRTEIHVYRDDKVYCLPLSVTLKISSKSPTCKIDPECYEVYHWYYLYGREITFRSKNTVMKQFSYVGICDFEK